MTKKFKTNIALMMILISTLYLLFANNVKAAGYFIEDLEIRVTVSENDIYEQKAQEVLLKQNRLNRSRVRIGEEEYFKRYKKIIEEYSEWVDPPETIYDVFTEEELSYLFRMVQTETNGSDFVSRSHVANVAFNRIDSERFPNDLKSVITSPSQFVYSKTHIDETTILACEYAFMFGDNVDGALFFHSHCNHNAARDSAGHHFRR